MSYSYLNNITLKKHEYSNWYGGLSLYRDNLLYDTKIKDVIRELTYKFKLLGFLITNHHVEISNLKGKTNIVVMIYYNKTNRKLMHDKVKSTIKDLLVKKINTFITSSNVSVKIDSFSDYKPLLSALYVAQLVASHMSFRINCRRLSLIAMKVISSGALGCIIEIKGKINGSDISRKDKVIHGKISRNTLENNIELQKYTYLGNSGCVGIKVWINKGKLHSK